MLYNNYTNRIKNIVAKNQLRKGNEFKGSAIGAIGAIGTDKQRLQEQKAFTGKMHFENTDLIALVAGASLEQAVLGVHPDFAYLKGTDETENHWLAYILQECFHTENGRTMMNRGDCSTRNKMLKMMTRSMAAVFAALMLMPLVTLAQTVDEVIARNVQAHGGIDKLKAVMTIKISQTIKAGGFQTEIRVENKRPDKIREEVSLQGLTEVLAYDGKVGWVVNPFSGRRDPEVMSQDDLKGVQDSADIDGPLVDYAQKGHKAELLGHDSVEGTDCYKVRLTLKNGDVRTYFLDTDSFLEIKIELQTTVRGTVQESELYFGDYEKVDGMYFPFAIEQGPKGGSAASRVNYTISKIELNVPLDDSLFTMPATSAPQPTPKLPEDVK